jgi:hypothetical protein
VRLLRSLGGIAIHSGAGGVEASVEVVFHDEGLDVVQDLGVQVVVGDQTLGIELLVRQGRGVVVLQPLFDGKLLVRVTVFCHDWICVDVLLVGGWLALSEGRGRKD